MLKETLSFAGLFLRPSRNRARAVYELLSTRHHLSDERLWLNLGWWEGGAAGYDEACAALARLLAEEAAFEPGQDLLDVGFGFADQDMLWAKERRPRRITGLNITPLHVEVARRRVAEAGLSGLIDLRVGSATDMPFEPGLFDRVTALECAFHFDTREAFFREAFRVLKPGGRLATADIVPREGRRPGWRERLADFAAGSFWQIPRSNLYPPSVYRAKLEAAGFKGVRLRSIRDGVFAPFSRYARRRLAEPALAGKLNPLVRAALAAGVKDDSAFDGYDYVLVSAEKPA